MEEKHESRSSIELPTLAKQSLDSRMKKYEREWRLVIPKDYCFLVRLDGCKFSDFTKIFKKNSPFSELFIKAMVLTMNDMVIKFSARTGYTHSDEITLIYPACEENQIHLYAGRVEKICSIMASYCTLRFNYHIAQSVKEINDNDAEKDKILEKLNEMAWGFFDCRVIGFKGPSKSNESSEPFELTAIVPERDKSYEILNHMIWRSVHDCERNAIQQYAQFYFGNKKINGKDCGELVKLLLDEKNINWETDIPNYIKHGIYAKREKYEAEIYVEYRKRTERVTRHKVANKCFKIENSDRYLECLFDKFWDENARYQALNF